MLYCIYAEHGPYAEAWMSQERSFQDAFAERHTRTSNDKAKQKVRGDRARTCGNRARTRGDRSTRGDKSTRGHRAKTRVAFSNFSSIAFADKANERQKASFAT